MEIFSPVNLWKEFDLIKLPLNTTIVSETVVHQCTVKQVYFNGEACYDGCTRIFARIIIPKTLQAGKKLPCVLMMDDCYKESDKLPFELAELGYAVMIADYCGKNPDKSRFTIYPKSLSHCNYLAHPGCVFEINENIKQNCWYVWGTIAYRSFTFLCGEDYIDASRIAGFGIGMGGASIIKLAIAENHLKTAVSLYNATGNFLPDSTDKDTIAFKAGLASSSYAPYIKIPYFCMITSNDADGSMDSMNDFFSALAQKSAWLSICERSNRVVCARQSQNVKHWLKYHLSDEGSLYPPVTLSAKESDHQLYFTVKSSVGAAFEPELYVSEAMTNPAFRNWHKSKLDRIGEGEYIAKIAVTNNKAPIYAFCNASYENGFCFSTPLMTKIPALMGIVNSEVKTNRLIYDSDMKLDDWLALNTPQGVNALSMTTGPYGIDGITSSARNLSTFKIGDMKYRGGDGVLQLIIYSVKPQSLKFTVTQMGSFTKFFAVRAISPSDNWAKFNLSLEDFKSIEGTLSDWKEAVCLEISGDEDFIINSVLWV